MKIPNKLTLAISAALSLSACSPNVTIDEYLTQAKTFSEKREHNSTIIALKNAVRIEPQNHNVRFLLGAAYLAQGDYLGAEKELEKSEKLGSDNALLMTYLVQAKVKLKKFDFVYQLVEQVGTFVDNDQVMLLTYAGIAAIHQGKPQLAKEYIEDAISLSDDSIYGQIGKAYISHSGNNYQDGLNTVDELLVTTPDFAEALLLKGYLLQASEEFDEAAKTFEQYAKLRPKDIQVKFFIAQNYVFAQNFDVAEPHVNLLLKISEFHPLANQFKAEIEFSRENFELAKEHAVTSFQQDDSFSLSKIIAGISAYKLDDYEQSYQYLISVKDLLSPEHLVRKLIIDLQLKLGYDTEAVAELQSLADFNAVDSAMLTMASNQMIASGNVEAAQELLQSSMAIGTSNPRDLAKQGITQLRLNQADKGIAILEQALKLDPELAFAERGLAAGYLANSQLDEALVIAKKWQATEEKRVRGYLVESAILEKQEKMVEAQALLNKVRKLDADNIIALYKLATYAHKKGEKEQAFDFYSQVLTQKPQHTRAMINFTRLIAFTTSESNEFTNRAMSFYKVQLVSQPENNSLKLGLSSIYRVAKNNEMAIKLLQEIASSKQPLKGIEIALGDSYKIQGDWQAAITEYQKFINANPKSLVIAYKLITLFEQTNKLDKAIVQLDKMIVEYQDNVSLLLLKLYYQSMLKIEPNQTDLVKIKVSKATANHWLLDKTLANIAFSKQDFSTSTSFYGNAYDKKINDVNAMHWSKSVALNGDKKKALEILENHLEGLPKGQVALAVKVMLAGAYINNNNSSKALAMYVSILKEEPENIIALNNLSYLELQEGNVKKSLAYAKQAITLKENNAAIIDTYAQALVANKQLKLAIEQYDKAISIDRTNVEFRINKAEALIINHQGALAESLLKSIETEKEQEQARIKQLLTGL